MNPDSKEGVHLGCKIATLRLIFVWTFCILNLACALKLAKKWKLDGAGFPGSHSMSNELPVLTLAHTGRPSTARNPDAGGSAHALILVRPSAVRKR